MKRSLFLKIFVLLVCCYSQHGMAQLKLANSSLQKRKEANITVRGNSFLLGNTITGLNRIPGIKEPRDPNLPYNGDMNNNLNSFGYIDIDGFIDENNDGIDDTFSSSSASFDKVTSCSSIVYAGLYWSASYYTKLQDNLAPVYNDLPVIDDRHIDDGLSGTFRDIKLKPPGVSDYINITPQSAEIKTKVIFDGWRNTASNNEDIAISNIPYVCYANITSILANLKNPNGVYTIANMRSALGNLRSGTESGWVLHIIYEDPNTSIKSFHTMDGFVQVSNSDFRYQFTQSIKKVYLKAPSTNVRLGIAALGGDLGIKGDTFEVSYGPRANASWRRLSSPPVNDRYNFFNSTISVDGEHNLERNPNSKNTLGFDIKLFNFYDWSGLNSDQLDFRITTNSDQYGIFLNTVESEIIEPKLVVTKRTLDKNRRDITGGEVNFGDELYYEHEISNQGNEDIINTTITNTLSANTSFIEGSIVADAGVTATSDNKGTIKIQIDDSVLERLDATVKVLFGVRVVADCSSLRDACSNDIANVATAKYIGEISDILKDGQESILAQDECRFDIVGASNFLIRNGSCFTETISTSLCKGQVELAGERGFDIYEWRMDNATGPIISAERGQTYTATSAGTYIVTMTDDTKCKEIQQVFEVSNTILINNNFINIVVNLDNNPNVSGNIKVCPLTAKKLPEFYLCGAPTTLNLDAGYDDELTNIIWQRLDAEACPIVTSFEGCPTTEALCEPYWKTVGAKRFLTVGNAIAPAGAYRVSIDVSGNCPQYVYFNIIKSDIKPTVKVVQDVRCNTLGSLEIMVSGGTPPFQFKISKSDGLPTIIFSKDSVQLVDNLTSGSYTVNVQEEGEDCVFVSNNVLIRELEVLQIDKVDITPINNSVNGTLKIQVSGGASPYSYELLDENKNLLIGKQVSNSFTITKPGVYVIVVTDRNGCILDRSVTFEAVEPNLLTDYAQEILFCTITGQSYPVVYIEDKKGKELDFSYLKTTSIFLQKLNEITCDIQFEENCPTQDSSCSSIWITLSSSPSFTIMEQGEYRVIVDFITPNKAKTKKSRKAHYFKAKEVNNLGMYKNDKVHFEIFPNPAENILNIKIENKQQLLISIFDVTGKEVFSTSKISFDISTLKSGVYFVRAKSDEQSSVLKLIKK